MKKQFLFILLLAVSFNGYSQNGNDKINAIGISIPVIWNNSEATYYSLGNRKEPKGKGTSYGVNINYSRSIYKNLFGIVGIGYFNQSFGIVRPFNFTAPDGTKPGVYTKTYAYNNIHFFIGLGYKMNVSKNLSIKGAALYNLYNSYRQKYAPSNFFVGINQINHKSLSIGNIINLNLGVEKQVTKKISIGIDLLLPLSTRWNNDEIFFKLGYSNDEQQIARNKFSIGTMVSCRYHF